MSDGRPIFLYFQKNKLKIFGANKFCKKVVFELVLVY